MTKKQKKFSGFVLRSRKSETLWGPFDTADKAVEWAIENFGEPSDWYVQPVRNPSF